MLDNTRLRAELMHIHRTLSVVAANTQGNDIIDVLRRSVGGTTAALLWQSLFADCLRVAHCAVAADAVIKDQEIEALYEFLFSAARHYASVMPASYGEFAAIDEESARGFLERYADDRGPFGHGASLRWPGLKLCHRAAELGDPEALERYQRMMTWLIDEACQIGGVSESDMRWRGRVDDLSELRRTLAHDSRVKPPSVDLRVQAFLTPSRVFAAVQQAFSIFDVDPFDVESIHKETRAVFEQLVARATTPSQHSELGRLLLVLGDSGAGKTHLLRGFRRYVHEYGRGFVAYAQLHSGADDYARYLLHHVIDSLARPYSGPAGERTGLHELASGLSRLVGEPLRSRIERLVDDTWETSESLAGYVNTLVDELLKQADLAPFDSDLLRVLLYALHPDHRMTSRIYKYLRCEDMNTHDRRWIGDAVPRTGKDEPHRMIVSLARLASVTQNAAFVIMVDQAELAGFEASTAAVFRRAIDALYRVVSEVPSAVGVVACLSDLYDQVQTELTMSAIDRLEKDPPIQRLLINRSYAEIEAIVSRRLSWLFAETGAVHREEEPVYPIPEAGLRGLTNHRTRAILEWCHEFQARCAAAGRMVELESKPEGVEKKPPLADADLDQIVAAWNDASLASGIELPDEEEEILAVIGAAAKACAEENNLSLTMPPRKNDVLRIEFVGGAQRAEIALAVTNSSYHGGSFTTQIETLRRTAGKATPVAVRTLEFPRGPTSAKVIAQLVKAGGRKANIDASTLRALAAFQRFRPAFPPSRVLAWRRRDRPVSNLPGIAQIFDLDRLGIAVPGRSPTPSNEPQAAQPAAVYRGAAPATSQAGVAKPPKTGSGGPGTGKSVKASPAGAATSAGKAEARVSASASQLRAGTSTSFQAEARTLELDSLFRHVAILGGPESGKTTLALNLIEQALERDVAVVMVDRKGDLAGYARPGWWQHTAEPERARRLAERLDVRLFTPGAHRGRPLSLPVVPDLSQIPEPERERMVHHVAVALAAMMRLGDSTAGAARRSILTHAIAVLAERKIVGGLVELIALIEDQDDDLVARFSRYDERLFKRLIQDLETLRTTDAELFDPKVEPLTADVLVGRAPGGKVPLAIMSTRFLGDVERIQAWVAHLVAGLARPAGTAAGAERRVLLMVDEAELFMPAGTAKSPSKEPLQDLLKRTPGAGPGVMLVSQSPADFDYRSREQIHSWFLGRIADRRSLEKMKQIFESKPAIRGKLSTLESGRFVMLQGEGVADLQRAPSLLRTEQLVETELMALAARASAGQGARAS
jgi:energy-coupling factor transporter ATP-binding protein EcfA2